MSRSRRERELSLALRHLSLKVKRRDPPPLTEKELRELAKKCRQGDKS